MMFKLRIDYTFLGLNLMLICLNLVYWLYLSVPVHDSLFSLQIFHVFYREFFLNGELPQWLPYDFYGLPSDFFWLLALSPAQYFALVFGKIFNIQNTFYLFLFSVYLEQVQLLTGSYLLAKKVLDQNISIVLMCMGIVLSSFWYIQMFINLRMLSFLPLILFLILKFSEDFNFLYISLAGIVTILSIFGNAEYFLPVFIYLPFLFLFLVLLVKKSIQSSRISLKEKIKSLFNPSLIFFSVVLFLIAVCYLSIALEALNFSFLASIGRDPNTKKVPLNVFLTYGGTTSVLRYLEYIWGIGFSEALLYVGVIPIVFLMYSVLWVRNTIFYTSLICLITILAVGLGKQGLIAPIIYYLPLFSYYRHIGLLVPIAKIFLLLCASLGIDHFFESLSTKKRKNTHKTLIICSFISIFLSSLYFFFESHPFLLQFPHYAQNSYFLNKFSIVLLLIFTFVNVYLYKKRKKKVKSGLIYCCFILYLIDIFSWHLSYLVSVDSHSPSQESLKSFIITDYSFQMKRVKNRDRLHDSRSLLVFRHLEKIKPGFASYGISSTFADADLCFPIYRQDFWNTFVNDLLKMRVYFHQKQTGELPENRHGHFGTYFPIDRDSFFYNTLGCTAPKIRLGIPSVNLKQEFDNDDVIPILQKIENPNAIIVNEYGNNKPIEFLEALNSVSDLQNDLFNFKVVDFSLNSLELNIELKKELTTPLWLIYADAFHPSWKAFVNEQPSKIFMANYAFKGIKLTNLKIGINHISFHFEHLPKVRTFLAIVLFIFSCCLVVLTLLNIFRFERF